MAKTKVTLEITGFKFEYEGEQAQLPVATKGLADQIAGMLQAPVAVDGQNPVKQVESTTAPQAAPEVKAKKRSRSKSNGSSTKAEAFDFEHKVEQWGNPSIDWKTADKALWMLFILEQEAGITEASAGELAATFNKHFKNAKTIRPTNVSRDLGAAKKIVPYLIDDNTTASPAKWFLTDNGKGHVRELISSLLGDTQD